MKIKAAIIGTGIGIKHFNAIENYRGSKVKIICERNKSKLTLLKKKFPKKIITSNEKKIYSDKDINLVSIASYDNFHFKQIMNSIKSKKNVIVEKPMCLNERQLKQINSLCNKNKKINITSNLVLRVNSLFNNFKNKIKNKKIFYIEGDYIWGRKKKLYGWRSKVRDYSITLGAGVHMIDLIMWLTNSKPISVYAMGNNISTKGTKYKKKSFVVMLFEFPKKIIAKITANGGAIYDHFHEMKIFCSKQTYINSRLGSFYYENEKFYRNKTLYPDKKNRKKLIRNFIDTILKPKTKPIITLKEQIDLMTVCFAVDKSLKLNRKIKINYL